MRQDGLLGWQLCEVNFQGRILTVILIVFHSRFLIVVG